MVFKRERSSYSPQLGDKDTKQNLSCPSSGSSPPVSKKPKEAPEKKLSDIKIHVVQAKLSSSEIRELSSIVEDSGATICASPSDAEVLVTNIRMKKRLERHIGWSLAVSVVFPCPPSDHTCVSVSDFQVRKRRR